MVVPLCFTFVTLSCTLSVTARVPRVGYRARQLGCVVVLLCVFILVWPPITVLALQRLLSAIDEVSAVSDVKDVPFSLTACNMVTGTARTSQECCNSAVVGGCRRCGGPDERSCSCDTVARAVVCGPGRLVGAIGNNWDNELFPNSTCTHVCKSVYSEDCAEDEEDAAARLASWGGGETVQCFVSGAGHVRLAAEPASTRVGGVVFMSIWVCFWTLPYWGFGCAIYRKFKERKAITPTRQSSSQ